jgi:hypothetical protein
MKALTTSMALILASLITTSTAFAGITRTETGDILFDATGSAGAIKVTITDSSAAANAPISAVYLAYTLSDGDGLNLNGVSIDNNNRVATLSTQYIRGGVKGCRGFQMSANNIRSVKLNAGNYFKICGIEIRGGSLNLPEDLKAAGTPLLVSYQTALQKLEDFNSGIKRSDQRHVVRLKQALQNAITKATDDKGNMSLPITHEIVRENSRLIMVLATVLNELLLDYDGVEHLKVPIEYLKSLSTQIRQSYGWNEGLAGSSSKSLAALGYVVDLEIRELYATMGAAGVTDLTAMNNLMRATHMMINRVKASNGGDAASQAVVNNFATVWNSTGIQTILGQLMNASADVGGLIQPKIKLLFMAIESISDLTNSGLLIPDQAPSSAPVKTETKIQKKK